MHDFLHQNTVQLVRLDAFVFSAANIAVQALNFTRRGQQQRAGAAGQVGNAQFAHRRRAAPVHIRQRPAEFAVKSQGRKQRGGRQRGVIGGARLGEVHNLVKHPPGKVMAANVVDFFRGADQPGENILARPPVREHAQHIGRRAKNRHVIDFIANSVPFPGDFAVVFGHAAEGRDTAFASRKMALENQRVNHHQRGDFAPGFHVADVDNAGDALTVGFARAKFQRRLAHRVGHDLHRLLQTLGRVQTVAQRVKRIGQRRRFSFLPIADFAGLQANAVAQIGGAQFFVGNRRRAQRGRVHHLHHGGDKRIPLHALLRLLIQNPFHPGGLVFCLNKNPRAVQINNDVRSAARGAALFNGVQIFFAQKCRKVDVVNLLAQNSAFGPGHGFLGGDGEC